MRRYTHIEIIWRRAFFFWTAGAAAARRPLPARCRSSSVTSHTHLSGGALFSFGPPARSSKSTVTAAARALLSEQCDVTHLHRNFLAARFFLLDRRRSSSAAAAARALPIEQCDVTHASVWRGAFFFWPAV